MAGCNFYSEETGDRCSCDEFDENEDSPKCHSCNHSELIHNYSPPAKSRKPSQSLKVAELLKSLGKVDNYEEANQEANKNLVVKKTKNAKASLLSYFFVFTSLWIFP